MTTLEAAARAIAKAAFPKAAWPGDFSDEERGDHIFQARKALEALREPSVKMTDAAHKAWCEIPDPLMPSHERTSVGFNAMITAALGEQP